MTINIIYKPTNEIVLTINSPSAIMAIMAVYDFRTFQSKTYLWKAS